MKWLRKVSLIGALAVGGCSADQSTKVEEGDTEITRAGCYDPEVFGKYGPSEVQKEIALSIHRVTEVDGSGGTALSSIEAGIKALNNAFSPLGWHFYIQNYQEIPHGVLSTSLSDYKEIYDYTGHMYLTINDTMIPGKINIYTMGFADGEYGYGRWFPQGLSDMQKDLSVVIGDTGFIREERNYPHAVGELFGLHNTVESGRGTNGDCPATAFDICDVPMDPGFFNERNNPNGCTENIESCSLTCGVDSIGQEYAPDINNYMSFYKGCDNHFSQEQLQVMACTAATRYPGLLEDEKEGEIPLAPVVSVGCDASSKDNLQDALTEITAKDQGVVRICPGTYMTHVELGQPEQIYHIVIEGRGDSPKDTVLDGDGAEEMIHVFSYPIFPHDITFRNLTFRNAETIFYTYDVNLKLDDVVIESSSALVAEINHGTLDIQNSLFKDNVSLFFARRSAISVSASTFSGNNMDSSDTAFITIHEWGSEHSSFKGSGVIWDSNDGNAMEILYGSPMSTSVIFETLPSDVVCSTETRTCSEQ